MIALSKKDLVKSTELKNFHKEVKLLVIFVTMKKVRTKERESMCFCTFSDQHNVFERFFSHLLIRLLAICYLNRAAILLKVLVMSERGALQLNVECLECRLFD